MERARRLAISAQRRTRRRRRDRGRIPAERPSALAPLVFAPLPEVPEGPPSGGIPARRSRRGRRGRYSWHLSWHAQAIEHLLTAIIPANSPRYLRNMARRIRQGRQRWENLFLFSRGRPIQAPRRPSPLFPAY